MRLGTTTSRVLICGSDSARASGKVGVVMVTSGPGATNTVTPVRDSMVLTSVPLVVTRPGSDRRDRHRCGRSTCSAIMGLVAKHVFSTRATGRHQCAVHLNCPHRPSRPVIVDIPKDVQTGGRIHGSRRCHCTVGRRRLAAVTENRLSKASV
jgi:acetolactate synthase-1/2/3 large subunit